MPPQIHNSFYLPGTPNIPGKLSLSEDMLFFELNLDGNRTPEQVIQVSNQGSRTIIRQVSLSLGSEDFEITNSNAFPGYLDAGQTFDIAVDFLARVDGLAIGLIEVWTDEDRLPYTIVLKSRTQRTAIFSDLYTELDAKIQTEAAYRHAADDAEVIARQVLDTALRALIASTNSVQDSMRDTADTALGQRISNMEVSVTSNGGLLAQILAETNNRIAADAYEASMRVAIYDDIADLTALVNSLQLLVTTQNNSVTTILGTQVSRIDTIEANYIDVDGVTVIAHAMVQIEQLARVSAVEAEALQRLTLEATLRGETTTALGQQAATFSAAIVVEQIARASAVATIASQITQLTARTSSARGITPNGTFEAGSNGWLGDMDFIPDVNGKISVVSAIGFAKTIYSQDRVPIDVNRAYQLNSLFSGYNTAIYVKIGLQCYADDGTLLGTIYGADADGTDSTIGTRSFHNVYSSAEAYPVGTQRTGTKFPIGTTSVDLFAQVNTTYVAGAYGRIFYLWLDDITNAFSVDARLTSSLLAQSDINGAFVNRLDTSEANYASAALDISGLEGENVQRIADLIVANSRITTEQTNRANAVLAEATRVDTLLASYTVTGDMNIAISAAVNTEAVARAAADGALATHIDSVEATLGGVSATASSALSAAVDAQGKLEARVVLEADAGNGRAQLTLHADSYGSAGVDIIGDVSISGSLVVAGSIITDKLASNSVTSFLATANTSNYVGTGSTWSGIGSAGGGGGVGGGGGSGGGGFGCVAPSSYMPDGGTAQDLAIGANLTVLATNRESFEISSVESIGRLVQPCYRITTVSGITLVASVTTPMTLRDGTVISIMHIAHHEVPVLDNGEFRWEEVATLDYLGKREVIIVQTFDGTYAAGEINGRYIFTHNKIVDTD